VALGASPRQIAALVLGGGARLCAWGIAVGLAGAIVTARALSGLLFGVSALDPRAYIGVSIALALASLWSCGLPARRATRVEPTVALRTE
jgi:ABC-type lipoprotein release transport system permease subunit